MPDVRRILHKCKYRYKTRFVKCGDYTWIEIYKRGFPEEGYALIGLHDNNLFFEVREFIHIVRRQYGKWECITLHHWNPDVIEGMTDKRVELSNPDAVDIIMSEIPKWL